MRYKINLHAHSRFSDGINSLKEMALEYKDLGFKVAVLTDHYYNNDPKREDYNDRCRISLTRSKIEEQRELAKQISRETEMGIILGIEIGIGMMEEVVIIGEKAIDEIVNLREERHDANENGNIFISDLVNIREKYPCMINLCHPNQPERWCKHGGHAVLDGFEYIHSGTLMFDRWNSKPDSAERKVPQELIGKIKLSNSDAHTKKCLQSNWNEIIMDVREEDNLLDYVKEGLPWYPVSTVRDGW